MIDIDGKITGTPGQLLERYVGLSKASDAKTTVGEVNYYPTVVKQKSQYVYWGEHETGHFSSNCNCFDGALVKLQIARQFNLFRSAAGSTDILLVQQPLVLRTTLLITIVSLLALTILFPLVLQHR